MNRKYIAMVAVSAATLLTGAGACHAQGKNLPTVSVAPFKDMSGADAKGPDGKPLPERLTSALKQFLTEGAKGRYTVAGSGSKFVVENEISALEVGPVSKRPYIVVTRLYMEKPRRLVAQYCGKAPTLRALTGNLERQADAAATGLIGGIAKEIGAAVVHAGKVADDASFDAMVKAATATRRITVDVLGDGGDQKPRQQIGGGEKFRLRVNSQDAGAVYIVQIRDNRPMVPYSQNEPLDVAQGKPVTLPPNSPFTAPKVKAATAMEYIVFVRKGGKVDGGVPVTPGTQTGAEASLVPTRLTPRAAPRGSIQMASSVSFLPRGFGLDQEDDKIELLSVTSPDAEGDAGIASLLQQYQNDPDDKWIAVRIKIAISPSGAGVPVPGIINAPDRGATKSGQ